MRIAGMGSIGGGEYTDDIKISGSGKITGNVKCMAMSCSGAAKVQGDITAVNDIRVSGSGKFEGNVECASITVSGAAKVCGALTVEQEADFSGDLKCDGKIKCGKLAIYGHIKSGDDIEADNVYIGGSIDCDGLINAERVEIKLDRSSSEVTSIGGSEIKVHTGKCASFVNKASLLQKIVGGKIGTLTVAESIEGDEIHLENVKAPLVIGRVVHISDGCEIETVRYSEKIEVSESSKVKETIKE